MTTNSNSNKHYIRSPGVLRRSIQCLHSMENNIKDTREIYNNTYGRENFNADNFHTSDIHINTQTHTGEKLVFDNLTNHDTSVFSDIIPGENEPPITVPELSDTYAIGTDEPLEMLVTQPDEMTPSPDEPPEVPVTQPTEMQPSPELTPAVRTRSG